MTDKFPKGAGDHILKVHKCSEGGLLYEFFRDVKFGQMAVRIVPPGKTAGGHSHNMREWWLVFMGTAVVRLGYPNGIEESLYVSGEDLKIIPLPPRTGHEIKNVGEDDMGFIFWAEKLYDPESHDKQPWSWEE